MRSLIVEDDFDTRLIMQTFLEELGQVVVAVDGKEAIHAYQASRDADKPFDVIFLDIMMPRMNGQQVLAEIRGVEGMVCEEPVKIIMTTALADLDNVKTAMDVGCDAYLKKPFSKKALFEELRKLNLIQQATL